MHLQQIGTGQAPRKLASPVNTAIPAPDAPDFEQPTQTDFSKRFSREFAWLSNTLGLSDGAARVLAARIAILAISLPPGRAGSTEPGLSGWLSRAPDSETLHPLLLRLGSDTIPAGSDTAWIERLWSLARPVEDLLASGGDDRLALDSRSGLNRYGCAPRPRAEIIGFGSCTASSLSVEAFAAAERARRSLIHSACQLGTGCAVAEATRATEAAILDHFGAADLAEAVLTASGTDAALAVTGLLHAEATDKVLTSVLVSPAETGSGVPLAVAGRHFAPCTPDGSLVEKGGALQGLESVGRVEVICLRDQNGAPRSQSSIELDCQVAITVAANHGRVVLHAIDGSKTGLTAPDRPTLERLSNRFGAALDIVIDACQARIEPEMVRWYLQQGFPVLITGSKFFAAPAFCGAVLFPRARLARITARGQLPIGLSAYMRLGSDFGSRQCAGLVLRWQAALHEMRVFARLPAPEVGHRLDRLGRCVVQAIARDARLALVAAPRPAGLGWSDRRSVFTFAVNGPDGWLDPARLRHLYLALQQEALSGPFAAERCQIGQPVELGHRALGGFRIALSAAQVATDEDLEAPLACVVGKLGGLLP